MYQLQNEELNSVITPFVIHTMFQHIYLLCIIKNNNNLKFEMMIQGNQWMDKGPWYNATILSKLNGNIFEYFYKNDTKKGMN